MAIEIKELHIRVTIEENPPTPKMPTLKTQHLNDLKSDIIRLCTKAVLEKIEEKQQR